jgi:Zn-finger protein
LCVERQNSHHNNDRHWCHWIRIHWWVNRAVILWDLKDRLCSIDKKETSKSLWQTKRSNYYSCHLFKDDHSRTHRKFYLYADHQAETINSDTRKIMNAQAWDQLSWKDEHHRILFWILHSFERDKDEDDEQKKTFLSRRNSFWINQIIRNLTRENTLRSSSKFFLEKEFDSINQLINQRIVFFEKTKNRSNLLIKRLKFSMRLEISDSILMSSKFLIRKRRNHCLRWTLQWLKRRRSTWWARKRT